VGLLHFNKKMQSRARTRPLVPHVGEGISDGVVPLTKIGCVVVVPAEIAFGNFHCFTNAGE
jgi:hypothetical protein